MGYDLKLEEYTFMARPLAEDEGGGYLIEYTDIPGCMSDGETIEEAIANGRDALRSVLLTMAEFGDPIRSQALPGLLLRHGCRHKQQARRHQKARERQWPSVKNRVSSARLQLPDVTASRWQRTSRTA